MSVQTSGTIRLASVEDIPEGQGREFRVGERFIAIFRHKGQFYAMEDVCPHAAAPLNNGFNYLRDDLACSLYKHPIANTQILALDIALVM